MRRSHPLSRLAHRSATLKEEVDRHRETQRQQNPLIRPPAQGNMPGTDRQQSGRDQPRRPVISLLTQEIGYADGGCTGQGGGQANDPLAHAQHDNKRDQDILVQTTGVDAQRTHEKRQHPALKVPSGCKQASGRDGFVSLVSKEARRVLVETPAPHHQGHQDDKKRQGKRLELLPRRAQWGHVLSKVCHLAGSAPPHPVHLEQVRQARPARRRRTRLPDSA